MAKKLTRSKRKELRARGELEPKPQAIAAHKAAERQAEERAFGARAQEAREAIARKESEDDDGPKSGPKPVGKPRDFTVLALLVGVIAIAGVLFWLTQRPPAPAATTPASTAAPK